MASMAKNNLLTTIKKEDKPITPVASVVAQSTAPDYSQFINQITEAQKAKTIADYQNAYQKSLGGLTETESKISPAYAQDRSNIQTTNVMEAKRLENLLAQQGLASAGAGETMSGAGSQRNLAQSIGFQGAMSSNTLAERQALDNIAKQKAQLGTDLQYNIASASSAADIQALQAQLEARRQADELARQETLRQETKATEATNAEKQAFLDTITRYSRDYSAAINTNLNDGNPANDWQIPYLEAMKQEKIATQNLDPLTGKPLVTNQVAELTPSVALSMWELTGVANDAIAKALGVNPGTKFPVQYSSMGSGGSSGGSSGSSLSQAQAIARWKALDRADQTIADYFGVPVGTKYGESPTTPANNQTTFETGLGTAPVNVTQIIQGISSVSPTQAARQIALWSASGMLNTLSDADADRVDAKLKQLGITDAMLNQAIRDVKNQATNIQAQ